MGNFKIGWNDGHTLSGVGTGAAGIIKETDRNRRIGSKARQILSTEYENVEIVNCTIDKSENDMYEAVKRANDANCNLFVSNHVNAGRGKGFETLYSRKSTQANINAAKIIHKHLVATKSCLLNRRCCDDYSYLGYDLYVLINTKMDAILSEIGFVDNQECVNVVNDDEVARAYATGIAEAYGLKKKTTVTNTTNTGSNSSSTELYRVRKSWVDVASQTGAYSVLDNAKKNCPSGYSVFDSKGNKVYPVTAAPAQKPPVSNKKYLNLNSHVSSWRVYPLNLVARVGNECGKLAPVQFGGLSYEILGNPQNDIYTIQTQSFGKVNIYAPRDNDSSITPSPAYK